MTYHFVVPCGGTKVAHEAPAAALYTGSLFHHTLKAAVAEAEATKRDLGGDAQVLILSALYGLVELGTQLTPYDTKMTDAYSVPAEVVRAQAEALGITYGDEVYALCPAAYRTRLAEALAPLGVTVADVYEAAPGVGYQRGVSSSLMRWS